MTLKLEGIFKGPWVDELQKAWSSSTDGSSVKQVKVDLAGVSFIDPKARMVLLQMQEGSPSARSFSFSSASPG